MVEKLQHKTRTYKKQIEDAEEIAALNLAKFRKAQQQLEEVGGVRKYFSVILMSTLSRPRTGATPPRPTLAASELGHRFQQQYGVSIIVVNMDLFQPRYNGYNNGFNGF